MKNETKEDRFKRVAARRTQKVLRDLRLLGNCGNKGNYAYAPEQIKRIFSEIDQSIKDARGKFHISKEREFKL